MAAGKKAGGKAGKKGGQPKDAKAGGAEKSEISKGPGGPKNLKESQAKDGDAWGKANERDVAKALQDLWGKVPPGYRRIVAQYFKDISGIEPESKEPDAQQGR